MRKISWLAILLIGGCTLILEQSNLVSLNDSSEFRFLDEQVFIRSCRQLKEESYDIFYAAENQKCLEDNAKQIQKLSEQIEQTNNLIKKEKLLDDVLVSSEKFNACKISKGLTVAGFAEQSNDSAVACWKRDKIIAYFTQVYQICENGEYTKRVGSAIILFVPPPIHYIFLLYPIRRNTFSEKDSLTAVLLSCGRISLCCDIVLEQDFGLPFRKR